MQDSKYLDTNPPTLCRAATLLLLLLAAPNARADSWRPFVDRIAASPDGRTYVIVRKEAGFELYRRAKSAPPYRPVPAENVQGVLSLEPDPPRPRPDPGDTRVHSGRLENLPLSVFVSNHGGFVAFERYARVGYGISIAIYGPQGDRLARFHLEDLFDHSVREQFMHSVSSIWWYRTAWIDEARQWFVVVSKDNRLLAVSMENGERIADPGTLFLLDHALRGTGETRETALDIALELRLEQYGPLYEAMAFSAEVPPALRLRAMLGTQELRSRPAVREMFKQWAVDPDAHVREYALRYLPTALGAEALPFLREAMKEKDWIWDAAQDALAQMGEVAVPMLCEMVSDRTKSPDYRGGAASALEKIKSPVAVRVLLGAVKSMAEYWSGIDAVRAAIACGGPKLRPGLLRLLTEGCDQDQIIAEYFKASPGPDAIPVLEAALARWSRPLPKDAGDFGGTGAKSCVESTQLQLNAALAACRGKSFDEEKETERRRREENPPPSEKNRRIERGRR